MCRCSPKCVAAERAWVKQTHWECPANWPATWHLVLHMYQILWENFFRHQPLGCNLIIYNMGLNFKIVAAMEVSVVRTEGASFFSLWIDWISLSDTGHWKHRLFRQFYWSCLPWGDTLLCRNYSEKTEGEKKLSFAFLQAHFLLSVSWRSIHSPLSGLISVRSMEAGSVNSLHASLGDLDLSANPFSH